MVYDKLLIVGLQSYLLLLSKVVFSSCMPDYSLFVYHKNDVYLHILIYVDDLIITRNNSVAIANFKKHLDTLSHERLGFSEGFSWYCGGQKFSRHLSQSMKVCLRYYL